MREIHLICVGKLKDKNLEIIETDFLKRINNPTLKIHEVKSHREELNLEAEDVIKKINSITNNESAHVVLLAENGKKLDSPKFSKWMFNIIENNKYIIYIIGGAAGHGKAVLDIAKEKLSLSEMTFPHKIARVLFVEQVYRAITIQSNHPYHK